MSFAKNANPFFNRHAAIAVVGLVIATCLVGIWLLSADARREIDALAIANADSAQWSVAQSEVELLALETAILATVLADPGQSLQPVRRRFDVFYSRMQTLQNSSLFARVLEEPDVRVSVASIVGFLDRTVPFIDGPEAELRAHLGDLSREIAEIRRSLRVITLASVRLFAENSAMQRERVANALLDLAILTIALVVVLVGTVMALLWSLAVGRRQTAAIAQAQSRLRTIIGTSLDGILVVGRDGRVLDFNGAAERIFGYSVDEAILRKMSDLIIPDHLLSTHEAAMEEYLKTGRKRVLDAGLVQLEAKDKAGRVFPVELSIATVDSDDGEIFVSFIRDISDRIAAERELVDARDKALEGEKAKAEFLAVMSHEMRTPLNGIMGSLELLAETDLSERQKGFVDILDSSGRMLLDHVNMVLDIASADAGRTVLRRDAFNLIALLDDVVANQSVQAQARGNRIELRCLGDTAVGMVFGDKTRLRQILVNLVANAVKFTKDGDITLTVERVDKGAGLEFNVIDTGLGIAPDNMARIFEDFVTLDSSYAREVEGTGLGLGIVRRLATAMGGTIKVHSDPGHGSTFTLCLPLPQVKDEQPDAAPVPAKLARHERIGAGISVLIVEDNEINRLIVREMLHALGCSTTECNDGQDGVDRANQQVFDLILMDISMPRLDGVTAAHMIRDGSGPNANTPIVALTAHTSPSDLRRFHAAGMTEVIVKPLSLARLTEILGEKRPVLADQQASVFAAHPSPVNLLSPDMADETLHRAMTEIGSALTQMSSCLDSDDRFEEIEQMAHQAAGLAAVVGMTGLRDALMTLELVMSELEGEDGETEALAEMIADATHLLEAEQTKHGATPC